MSNNEKGFQLVPIFQDIKKIKYHSRKRDVDFDILKKNSKYFNDHQDEYKNKKEINLTEDEISEDTIDIFISICENKKFELDETNIFDLYILSLEYGVINLTKCIDNYILTSDTNLAIKFLVFKLKNVEKSENSLNYSNEINTISSRFIEFIQPKNDLKSLPVPILNLILEKYLETMNHQINQSDKEKIRDFLFTCLDEHPVDASVLFLKIDLDENILSTLFTKYREKFCFKFLNPESFIDKYLELQLKYEKSNQIQKQQKKTIDELAQRHFYFSDIDKKTDGIIASRSKMEKFNKFDHEFVASLSTNDIYDLINQSKNDFSGFYTSHISNSSYSSFTIELEKPRIVDLIKIYASEYCNPVSFAFKINDGEEKEIKKEELIMFNDKDVEKRVKEINLEKSVLLEKITIYPKDPDENKKDVTYPRFKRVELFSPECKTKGIFEELCEECKDCHKCRVFISSTNYGTDDFFVIKNNEKYVGTESKENSWFQIELTKGFALLSGFRLNEIIYTFLVNYKIIGTYEYSQNEESWTTLYECNEYDDKEKDPYKKFPNISPPIRYIKLINRGECLNLNNNNKPNGYQLKFYDFDIFGYYFPLNIFQ